MKTEIPRGSKIDRLTIDRAIFDKVPELSGSNALEDVGLSIPSASCFLFSQSCTFCSGLIAYRCSQSLSNCDRVPPIQEAEHDPFKIIAKLPKESARLGYFSCLCLISNRLIGRSESLRQRQLF